MAQDQISQRLIEAFEQNSILFDSLSEELREHFRVLITSQVEKLGLVSREEFDALRASLDKADARITELEHPK